MTRTTFIAVLVALAVSIASVSGGIAMYQKGEEMILQAERTLGVQGEMLEVLSHEAQDLKNFCEHYLWLYDENSVDLYGGSTK
jgi:hypothetical protein